MKHSFLSFTCCCLALLFCILCSSCTTNQNKISFKSKRDRLLFLQNCMNFHYFTSGKVYEYEEVENLYDKQEIKIIKADSSRRIYGKKEPVFLVEIKLPEGAMAGYPWKMQVLISQNKSPLYSAAFESFQWLRVLDGEAPFLLGELVSSKGNGEHLLIGYKEKQFQDFLHKSKPDASLTIMKSDRYGKKWNPTHMKLEIQDATKDGYKDLLFSTQETTYTRQGKKIKLIRKNFIYSPQNNRFEFR